jgi:hypothetical protein
MQNNKQPSGLYVFKLLVFTTKKDGGLISYVKNFSSHLDLTASFLRFLQKNKDRC